MAFVAESSTGASHQVGIVFADTLLLAPHAPAHKDDATEENGTSHATNDTADNGFAGGAEAAAAAVVAVSSKGRE